MVAQYNPNATNTGKSTSAPGSSGNTKAKTHDLQILVGSHSMKKGQKGPPLPAYHSLGYMLEQPFHDPAKVRDIQQKLVAAGFLAPDSFVNGIYDDETISAYKDALTSASFYGKQFDTIIQERVKAGVKVKGGTERAPFSPQVSSPEEIKAALNQALPNILGHGVTDDELNHLTSLYQSLQVGAQRQTYDTAIAGGTATSVMPIDVFAEQQAEKIDPNAVQANKFGALAAEFRKSLSNRSVETATF